MEIKQEDHIEYLEEDDWNELVRTFILHPGEFETVAQITGLSVRDVQRCWEHGLNPRQTAIKFIVESVEEAVKGQNFRLALIREQAREEERLESLALKKRTDEEETQLTKVSRTLAMASVREVGALSTATAVLAKQIQTMIHLVADYLNRLMSYDDPIEHLSLQTAMKILRDVIRLLSEVNQMRRNTIVQAGYAIKAERIRTSQSILDELIDSVDDDLTEETVQEHLMAVLRAAKLSGFDVNTIVQGALEESSARLAKLNADALMAVIDEGTVN